MAVRSRPGSETRQGSRPGPKPPPRESLTRCRSPVEVQDTPTDAGLGDFGPQDATSGDTEPVTLAYVAKRVFTNPIAVTIAVAEFCAGLVRKRFEEWFPRYMQEAQNLALDHPILKSGALAIVVAGIAGAFIAGTMSDWVFKPRRPPVAFIGYALQVACLIVIWRAPSLTAIIVASTLNSLAISMVHSMLSGTASMDFGASAPPRTPPACSTACSTWGSSFAGYGLGKLIDLHGWGVWAPSMVGFAAIGGVLMWCSGTPGRAAPARDTERDIGRPSGP